METRLLSGVTNAGFGYPVLSRLLHQIPISRCLKVVDTRRNTAKMGCGKGGYEPLRARSLERLVERRVAGRADLARALSLGEVRQLRHAGTTSHCLIASRPRILCIGHNFTLTPLIFGDTRI